MIGRVAAKKPLLRCQNKRLPGPQNTAIGNAEEWKKILWTAESKFQIYGSSRRVFVCSQADERMVPQCVTSAVKQGGGSVMVWSCFAGARVDDLYRVSSTLNQTGYHTIVQHHAISSGMCIVCQRFILQQDNDPKRKFKLCQNYLNKKEQDGKLENMERPVESPDLTPVKLVWDELDKRVKDSQSTSATYLWGLLKQTW